MISIVLQGGLGNQLFQIAAASSIANKNNCKLCLPKTPETHHSKQNYYDTIFKNWQPEETKNLLRIHEQSYKYQTWNVTNVELFGYFQNFRYIEDEFIKSLALPDTPILDGAFLHVRGGDYLNHSLHHIDLTNYYQSAIRMFPRCTKFYIFTNDTSYAKTISFLNTIDHEFIEESDELRTLSLMKNCKLGGICANSTFSWWGAYLNRNARTLVIPSKWFNTSEIYIEGYFFPEAIICQV